MSHPDPNGPLDRTPIQIGENFYGSRDLYWALQVKACDLVMRDFMRSALTG